MKSTIYQPPSPSSPSIALTLINVTFNVENTIYLRNTHIHNIQNDDNNTIGFFLATKLTTHADTLVEFRGENLAQRNIKKFRVNSKYLKKIDRKKKKNWYPWNKYFSSFV